MKGFTSKNSILGLVSLFSLLALWKGASLAVGADIILPPPEEAFLVLLRFLGTGGFWSAVGATIVRGILGFLFSFLLGTTVGILAGTNDVFHALISPLLQIIRSTPVMGVILLAVMWFTRDAVPVFVAFLMSFPIVCQNVIQGTRKVDQKLLEMARVYRISRADTLRHIFIPSIVPYTAAAATATLGLTWKVVIAAEVLSLPLRAVGTGMQFAQINLEAAEVFAWTITAIALGFSSEKMIKLLIHLFGRKGRRPAE